MHNTNMACVPAAAVTCSVQFYMTALVLYDEIIQLADGCMH